MTPGSDIPPQPSPIPERQADRVPPEHRDHAVEMLTQHFAGDRLSLDEFEQRTAAIYAARTVTAVQAALADLPEIPAGTLHATALLEDGRTGTTSVAGQQQLTVMLSNHERRGPLVVPAKLRIRNLLGNVELDLRDATFTAAITEIDVSAVLGNVEIIFPLGVRVESEGEAILGSFATGGTAERNRSPASAVSQRDARTPVVVRLTGKSVLASVEVHSRGPQTVQEPQHTYDAATGTPALGRSEPRRLLP